MFASFLCARRNLLTVLGDTRSLTYCHNGVAPLFLGTQEEEVGWSHLLEGWRLGTYS